MLLINMKGMVGNTLVFQVMGKNRDQPDILDSVLRRKQAPFAFGSFASDGFVDIPTVQGPDDYWVTCSFSSHSDTLLYLGSNYGSVAIFDVRHAYGEGGSLEGGILSKFVAHKGVVMDLQSVPNKSNELLTVSGDSTVRLWDISHTTPTSSLFLGHEATVRTASFCPDDANVFATGGRDGQIRLWDTRMTLQKERRSGLQFRAPRTVYSNTHAIRDSRHTPRKTPNSKRKEPTPNVISLLFLNEYSVVSGSDSAASGLRIWDTRKMPTNGEGHVMTTLQVPSQANKRDVGVISLALDRHGSSLFAAVTDNQIYEYAVTTSNILPVRALAGAAFRSSSPYDFMLSTSPASDHVICGTSLNGALIWDVAGGTNHLDVLPTVSSAIPTRDPSFQMGGHETPVSSVAWSHEGNYIVSLDELQLRVWSRNLSRSGNEELSEQMDMRPNFKRIDSLHSGRNQSSPSTRPLTRSLTSPRKRVSYANFSSPRKSSAVLKTPSKATPTRSSNLGTPGKSPRAKKMRISSPVLPLMDMTNLETSPTSRSTEKKRKPPRRQRNAFHARYPTENLPNSIYERFVEQLRPSTSSPSAAADSPSLSARKKLEDWWQRRGSDPSGGALERAYPAGSRSERLSRVRLPSVSEFGESVCAKMTSEDERLLQSSPRKLVLKKTPLKNQPPASLPSYSAQREKQDAPSSATRRRSNRNLLDYFSKTLEK